MRHIALVAVDLDGTLLQSDKRLAPAGARCLRQAARRGAHVVLATTRNPNKVQEYCRALGLDGPMICTNGAQVWASPSGPVWAHYRLAPELASTIARLADRNGWELSVTAGSTTYWRQRSGQALGRLGPSRIVVAQNADALTGDVVRILAHQPEAITAIRSLCQSSFAHRCRLETYYRSDGSVSSVGVFARDASKGAALGLVLGRLGVDREETMAIGDNPNDLPMFSRAGISVAMANAPDQVKQAATIVAPSNDDEGVAWAVRRFVLGGG